MTLAWVRRPTCAARPADWKASPRKYTPPWKYKTTLSGSIPAIVISAVGTAPRVPAVTVTSAGGGADANFRSSSRCSLTLLSTGKADCRRAASSFSRCSALTESPFGSVGLVALRLVAPRVSGRHRIPVIRSDESAQSPGSGDDVSPVRRTVSGGGRDHRGRRL